jgi:sugar phosphate isomerase/epimerase
MNIGVITVLFGDRPLGEALDYIKSLGVTHLEIGGGGYPGRAHCVATELVKDKAKRDAFINEITSRGMTLNALSAHGNPVHPDKEIAKKFHEEFEATVELAGMLGVEKIIGFSGCPGDHEGAKYPNWCTCAWPDDYLKILDWQWNEVLIPYWIKETEFMKKNGVNKFAIEMHPGFCVYNPETLMKLRNAVGDVIGANFDPSHLIWQGIEPVAAIRYLGKAIYHVHAKDTKVDKYNTAINGVLDTKHYSDEINRSWVFRSVGYGNDMQYWRDLISNLRLVGYDDVLSIEHEDSIMTNKEGLEKAVSFLKDANIVEPKPTGMHWA